MDIAWYGHAAFRLRGREASVVTDPCPAESGFRLNRPNADIVTVSNPRSAHSWVDGVQIEPSGLHRPLNAPGEYEVKRVLATGVETPGPDGRRNIAFVITIDDVIVAHLGDVREMPSPAALEELQRASVCLLPVGAAANTRSCSRRRTDRPRAGSQARQRHRRPADHSDALPARGRQRPADRPRRPRSVPPRHGRRGRADNHINVTTGNLPATPTVQPSSPAARRRSASALVEVATDNHINVTTGNLPATPTVQPLLARGA